MRHRQEAREAKNLKKSYPDESAILKLDADQTNNPGRLNRRRKYKRW